VTVPRIEPFDTVWCTYVHLLKDSGTPEPIAIELSPTVPCEGEYVDGNLKHPAIRKFVIIIKGNVKSLTVRMRSHRESYA